MSGRYDRGRLSASGLRGFTLIELLVALAVFSSLSVMAYGGLRTLMITRAQTEQASQRLSQLQTSLLLLQQDLEQMVARGIRNEYGDPEPALVAGTSSDYLLAFTRGGWRTLGTTRQSTLRRIGYQLEDGELQRLSWPVLDRARDSEVQKTALLQGVQEIGFRFLQDSNWIEVWPQTAQQNDKLPSAVEITLTLDGWGELRRLFTLPH